MDQPLPTPTPAPGSPAPRTAFDLPPPLPRPLATIDHMRVTDFRTYLESPYRFYLARGLLLEALDDAPREMDALVFGTLAHEVLHRFGREDAAGATDVTAMRRLLRELLRETARDRFGAAPLPAVRIQIAQLEMRLMALAEVQARHVADGWVIRATELTFERGQAHLSVDDKPMSLTGRIDRVDYHPETDRWLVLDYKTGNKPTDPDKTHRKGRRAGREWVDLQLPLYRRLLTQASAIRPDLPIGEGDLDRIEMGYVLLPPRTVDGGLALAEWGRKELKDAEDLARRIVRDIRSGRFEFAPDHGPPRRFDPFAAVCGVGLLAPDEDEEDDPAEPEP